MRKICTERRRIRLQKEVAMKKFEEKESELGDVRAPNLSGHFKN